MTPSDPDAKARDARMKAGMGAGGNGRLTHNGLSEGLDKFDKGLDQQAGKMGLELTQAAQELRGLLASVKEALKSVADSHKATHANHVVQGKLDHLRDRFAPE